MSDDLGMAVGAALGRDAAWRDLERRSRNLRRLLLACFPVLALAYVVAILVEKWWLYPLVALAWLAAIGRSGARMASFACPGCGGAFFENWYFFKPLRRNCAQCSLPRGTRKDAASAATAAQH